MFVIEHPFAFFMAMIRHHPNGGVVYGVGAFLALFMGEALVAKSQKGRQGQHRAAGRLKQ